MQGEELIDKWLEEIYQKDMEWYYRIRDSYNTIKNDYPEPPMKYSSTPERLQAWRNAQNFLKDIHAQFLYGIIEYPSAVEKIFRRDLKNRKKNLMMKIENKVGDIQDINIKRNIKGGFDGYVKGSKGTAYIETKGAGGYNIQRFHFRTYVK